MIRDAILKKTFENLTRLPDQKLKEVSDFTEFLIHGLDDKIISEGIQSLIVDSNAFKFLEEEEELYAKSDLKEIYK